MSELSMTEVKELLKHLNKEETVEFRVDGVPFEVSHHTYDAGTEDELEVVEYMRAEKNYPYKSIQVSFENNSTTPKFVVKEIIEYVKKMTQ